MKTRQALAVTALAVPALMLSTTTASAAPGTSSHAPGKSTGASTSKGTEVYRSHLMPLNDSGATGRVMLHLRGNELTVRIKARGLLPNAVHAQHIHGEGNSECPPMSAAGDDGVLTTPEGVPFYGGIAASLTVTGDTSPAAGLAIELMPVADDRGRIDYRRTITLPDDVAEDLQDYQIVQHGADLNSSGEYDFGPGSSSLDPGLPLEATVPANCGTIERLGKGHGHGNGNGHGHGHGHGH
jgi:hypothetical protein